MAVKLFTQLSVANSKFTGVTSGAAVLKDADISGTTGSPTTATYTDGGINFKTFSFTGSGSITLDNAGLIDCLLVGAGGGGATSLGGGGAGSLITNQIFLPAGTFTVTVGAGGAVKATGNISAIGLDTNTYNNVALGGGSALSQFGGTGSSGSGGNGSASRGLAINTNLGKNGGTSTSTNHCGGGGGLGSQPADIGTASVGGVGGVGINNDFRTGANQQYGGGGGGGGITTGGASGGFGSGTGGSNTVNATAGTANTGAGGGAAFAAGLSGAGGSGIVALRVLA